MDWDRVEGNWKQVKGKVKGKMGKAQRTMTWPTSMASATNSKAKSRNVTESLAIRCVKKSTIGRELKACKATRPMLRYLTSSFDDSRFIIQSAVSPEPEGRLIIFKEAPGSMQKLSAL